MPRYTEEYRVREARRVSQADKKIQALSKVTVGNFEAGDFKKFLRASPFCRNQRDEVRELYAKYVTRQEPAAPAAPQV